MPLRLAMVETEICPRLQCLDWIYKVGNLRTWGINLKSARWGWTPRDPQRRQRYIFPSQAFIQWIPWHHKTPSMHPVQVQTSFSNPRVPIHAETLLLLKSRGPSQSVMSMPEPLRDPAAKPRYDGVDLSDTLSTVLGTMFCAPDKLPWELQGEGGQGQKLCD